MVAMISSQARRSSASVVTIRRALRLGRRVRRKPRMIRAQSCRKKISSATAVATCRATMNARYGLVWLVEAGRFGDQVLPVAADEGRQEHRVAEAGDREQFGDPLQQADDDGLQVGEHGRTASWYGRMGRVRRSG